MTKPYVFISGPINSSGYQNRNVRKACLVAEQMIRHGLVPFVPHLDVFWDMISPGMTNEDWMSWDLAWLEKCDALYRLSGESKGADREVAHAHSLGIPVFAEDDHGLVGLFIWSETREGRK